MNTADLILANDSTTDSTKGFNSLFVRLEALRKKHLNKDGQTSAANTALKTAFSTAVAVAGEQALQQNVQTLKTNITTLTNSTWLDSSFASKITVPAVGELMEAVDFNSWDNVISEMETICANYSKYGQNYSQTYFNGYDHYS